MINLHDSIIVQKVGRLLVPFIQVFGIYVLFHGHYSPGGGFQAGVLLGAATILKILCGTQADVKSYSVRREFSLASLGLVIYTGLGTVALFGGGRFLDYHFLPLPGLTDEWLRYYGILGIEIGITLTVAMTIIIIFHVLTLEDTKGQARA